MTTLSTPIPVPVLAAAARALTLAGRFTEATTLLDAAGASDPAAVPATAIPTGSVDAGGAGRTGGIPELAVLRAEAAVSADYRFGTATAEDALATAEKIVAGTGDAEAEWDLAFLQVRHRYFGELFDPAARFGSTEGRDPERITRLRHDAAALGASAPDGLHRGWAEFYLGLIADNVYGERDVAPAHYRTALTAAESAGDDLLQFETLRHLGDHDHDDGDTDLARDRWEPPPPTPPAPVPCSAPSPSSCCSPSWPATAATSRPPSPWPPRSPAGPPPPAPPASTPRPKPSSLARTRRPRHRIPTPNPRHRALVTRRVATHRPLPTTSPEVHLACAITRAAGRA